ncbi:hypothetical protein SLEP1_g53173 [Rubroshorea leprosula]|uniref:Integrase catalytic domain-containing protein n=1 Tax=Rubroshorea leprosula TaxID=152421 RepID=A0AAV5MAZ2_9ROSI|nr:hypothetical protein SLEP1_g53173 [Rubroshorea leprosula]
MVRTFTGGRPPRNEMDEQENAHVSEPGFNDFRPMPRNLFVGGAEQDHLSETDDERTPIGYATQPEQVQVPTGTRRRPSRPHNSQHEQPERSTEPARTTELEERTRVLEMAMGKILARLIPDDPLIPLLNRDAQPAAVVATRNSPALSNVVVPTRPRGSGKLNIEPSSSKHSEELMRKNADLERQLQDVQKSIDELKSPRSHQQTLDLDSAPLNLSITAEPYQEGFKIPHLETYDGTGDPDEHLHTYQAIMRIQNANDVMMCKVFPATLKSTARRWYHKLPRHSIYSFSQLAKLFSNKFASQREIKRTATELMQVNQKEGESLRDYMQRFNKATLDIDNVPDTICLSAMLHGLKHGRFLDDLFENPPKTWNEQAAIDEEVQKLLQAGFIRRVEYSEWVSNPVLVKKPNGKWRMCIDFTNLNDACPKDPHPLPNVEKLVEWAAGHERMSFLNAISGYHQVQLLLDDQEKTAFYAGYVVSKKGIEVNPEKVEAVQQMEPPRTVKDVQRLTGRVAALHRFIARSAERCLPFFKALREPKNFQWTDECQQAFDELKRYLASAPLLSKPVDGESLYLYLGVTEEAVSSVLLREENKHQKPICYVSKVLQGAEQNYPLAEKAAFALKPELSGRLIGWSVELSEYDLKFQPRTTVKGQAVADFLVECAPAAVKEKVPEYPVWVLYVDGAANVEGSGAGAVLLGPDGFKSDHALRFKFQTTNNAAEYEALIYGLKLAAELKLRHQGSPAQSLCLCGQQMEVKDINPQRSTIVEVLDAPSYIDFTVDCQLLSTDPSTPSWTTPLINYLQSGELPEDLSAAKLIKRRAAHFTLLDNQLYKRATSMPLLRCLTPYEAEYAVREVHEGVCGTHIGGKTLARKLLRHGYYWPSMVEDAQRYVKKCPTCQFNADDIHMPGEMLSSLTSPWPFAQWGVDLLGPFIKGKGGSTFLVVAVDYFTKFGIPKRIIADNGPQFRAAALRSFCNDYGIELALTSVYTPQSNGQAESANKIVLRGLRTRVLAAHSNWVDELNKVLWSCRTTPSSATGETPFSLAYGAEAVIPVEVGLPSDRAGRHDDLNNEQLLRENLDFVEEVREMSRIRNVAYQNRVAKFYNKRVRARQFQVGDLVLRKAGLTNTRSHMGKLAPNWEGPYMVVQVKRPGSYVLTDIQRRQLPYIWNIQNLRKFYS